MFNQIHTSCDFHRDVLGYAFQNLCLKNPRIYPLKNQERQRQK